MKNVFICSDLFFSQGNGKNIFSKGVKVSS